MSQVQQILFYKGYYTIPRYSVKDGLYYGRIEGISDLVCYESDARDGIMKEFRQAVDDYLAYCADTKQLPNAPPEG